MRHRTVPTAWFVVFASLTAPSYAVEPEFKAGLVTESRLYERMEIRKGSNPGPCAALYCGAVVAQPVMVQYARVTVALEGERISGESYGLSSGALGRDWLAEDFPLGTEVQVATRGNQLLLKHPDGRVVRARIRNRVKTGEDELD